MPTVADLRFTRPVEALRCAVAATLVRPAPSPGGDLHIVSSPRSGSTWLMEALGAQAGFGCVNEPLHKRRLECLPDPGFLPRWRYDHVAPSEAEALRAHLTDRVRLRAFLNIHPFRPSFCRHPDRLVIKMVRAAPILPWLVENLPGSIIYLCRHPIPQAISAQRRSHAVRGREYLSRAVAGHISVPDGTIRELERRLDRGDELTHRVVEWCLENLPAVQLVRRYPRAPKLEVVRYEDVVRDFAAVLRRVDRSAGLPDWSHSLPASEEPSRVTNSSTRESVQAIRDGNSTHLIRGWRSKISADRVRELIEIPSMLGIPLDVDDDSVGI